MTELMDRKKYVSGGVHLGVRKKAKDMEPFIFKSRSDGLSIIDIERVEERIEVASSFLSRFENVMIAGRKDNAKLALKKFGEATGFRVKTKRFMPGTLTNPSLPDYCEPDAIMVVDPLIDKEAVQEAIKKRVPVIAICDSFTDLDYIDLIIPGNNKGKKSLGIIFYLLAREVLKKKGEIESDDEFGYELIDFTGEEV